MFWPKHKVHYHVEYDEAKEYPYFIPSGKPARTHSIDEKPVPWFSTDANAARLLMAEIEKRPKILDNFFYHLEQQLENLHGYWNQADVWKALRAEPKLLTIAAILAVGGEK